LVSVAWKYRHNLTAADALYVALAEEVNGALSPMITSSLQLRNFRQN
jgi:predicted nucleic acid-binding protein